jgi:putative heme iron utilization protein
MEMQKYFKEHQGTGILATADKEGKVDVAVYACPHVIDDKTIAFIMRLRRSYQNLKSNPKAAYMFIEKTPGYHGTRLYLKKLREETDMKVINSMRRSHHGQDESSAVLVYFTVEEIRPLTGDQS